MIAYEAFQKTLVPYIENNVPTICIDNVRNLGKAHKRVLEQVHEYYNSCSAHTDYLQKILDRFKNIFSTYGVEYSCNGLFSARERLLPIFEKFQEQHEETDKVAHAILFMVVDYINTSPFNNGIKFEGAPTLALLSVNVFLVAFSSTLVAMASIHNKMSNKKK
tara:strand:- start:97 stop:585 length:489 start_codon:yes stop_codon:yes gene_type:complete